MVVKWKKDGSLNIVNVKDLYITSKRPLQKGTCVKMRSKTSWWKGRIIQLIPKTTPLDNQESDESDESDDDVSLAILGKQIYKVLHFLSLFK